jgi:hypothetical protein
LFGVCGGGVEGRNITSVELLPIEDGTVCRRYFEEPYSKVSSFFPNKIIAIHLKEQNDTNSLSQVRTN